MPHRHRSRTRSAATAAAAILALATLARADTYTWTYLVPPDDGTVAPPPSPTSYTDPANWAPLTPGNSHTPPPAAGDTALFNAGNTTVVNVTLPTSLTHDQLQVLNDRIILSAPDPANPTTLTLTRPDNAALQLGPVATPADAYPYLETHDLHLNLPSGGLTVTALPSAPRDGDLEAYHTQFSLAKDFTLGTAGGYGYAYLTDSSSASVGGNLKLGASGGGGQLDLFTGSTMTVAGNLVVLDTAGNDGVVNIQNAGPGVLPTGISVAGDVRVGAPDPNSGPTGGSGNVLLYRDSYLHANGDWTLYGTPAPYDGATVDISHHSEGSARNLSIGENASFTVVTDSRFDVHGDATVHPGGYLGVFDASTLTVTGTLTVEPGAYFDAGPDTTVNALLLNHGNFYVGGLDVGGTTPHLAALTQAPDGLLLVDLASPSDFDHLLVDGTASLAGTLELDFAKTFTPTEGQSFDILDAAQTLGTFSSITTNTPGWYATFNPSTGTILLTQSIPEPTPLSLLALTVTPLLPRRRRHLARPAL